MPGRSVTHSRFRADKKIFAALHSFQLQLNSYKSRWRIATQFDSLSQDPVEPMRLILGE